MVYRLDLLVKNVMMEIRRLVMVVANPVRLRSVEMVLCRALAKSVTMGVFVEVERKMGSFGAHLKKLKSVAVQVGAQKHCLMVGVRRCVVWKYAVMALCTPMVVMALHEHLMMSNVIMDESVVVILQLLWSNVERALSVKSSLAIVSQSQAHRMSLGVVVLPVGVCAKIMNSVLIELNRVPTTQRKMTNVMTNANLLGVAMESSIQEKIVTMGISKMMKYVYLHVRNLDVVTLLWLLPLMSNVMMGIQVVMTGAPVIVDLKCVEMESSKRMKNVIEVGSAGMESSMGHSGFHDKM
jgi:hypothetical protein